MSYRLKYNVVEVQFRSDNLVVYVLPYDGDINDKIEDVPTSYNFTLNKRINIYDINDIEIAVEHIRKTYTKYI